MGHEKCIKENLYKNKGPQSKENVIKFFLKK